MVLPEKAGAWNTDHAWGHPSMSTNDTSGNDSDGTECPTCGDEFDSERGVKSHHKQVHGESIAGVTVACANCGKEMTRPPSEAESGEMNVCSKKCQDCGLSEEAHLEQYGTRLEVHHIRKARLFDDPERRNDESNLITLCKGCHLEKWEKMAPLRPVTE